MCDVKSNYMPVSINFDTNLRLFGREIKLKNRKKRPRNII